MQAKTNDPKSNQGMVNIEEQGTYGKHESQFLSEILMKSYQRYKTEKSKNAIKEELQKLLEGDAFVIKNENKIKAHVNVLGGRFIFAI